MTSSQSHSEVHNLPSAICWLFPLILTVAVFIVYQPAWHGGFLWDEYCVPHDPHALSHYTWKGLYDTWFQQNRHQYYPLTYTTCWLEYHLWGLNTTGYHLDNILLHSLSSILLWIILRRLSVPGAWLAAAIFALHPVNAESVAWIAERKNCLSCFFFLCSILAALRFWLPELQAGVGSPQSSASPLSSILNSPSSLPYYWLSFALYVCALFSKTTTIPLPAVILLLVWWKRGRIAWADVKPSILFFAAGFAMGLITHWAERNLGAHGKDFQISFIDRVLIAGRSYWFYLGKLFWPHPIIFIYPHWKIAPSPPLAWLSVLVFIPVLAILWLKRNTWGGHVFVALAYFGGMLFVMLGFFNLYFFLYSFVADHFQYEACMGPIALFAAALTTALCRSRGNESLIKSGSPQTSASPVKSETPDVVSYGYIVICACILAILGTLTWRQSHMYTDVETLWHTTAERNPESFLAHTDLADILTGKGQMDAAIQQYRMSLAVRKDPETCHNLGNALLQTGRPDEAAMYFKKSLEIDPNYAVGYSDLGNMYLQKGQLDLAIQYMQKALQIEPLPITCYNLGNAYAEERRLDLAIDYWEKAIQLQPDYPMPHGNLGNAFMLEGQTAKAIQQWKLALQYMPDLTSAQMNLAWVLATSPDASLRDGQTAVALAERATQLTQGRDPAALRSLAAAFAENGQYPDAVATAQQALQMSRGNPGLATTIQEQLKLYQNHQPYRDQPPSAQIKR
ncbi:MAG TPA: tetratricopeptide repeat protein [Candidatus Acidoferrales bacterium]|jgi:tetratricopeptide (TPR) repeat protein|nr:tetratricopeptide repeat protein [Candidatus Acidoferrales bacterium]